MTLGFCCLDPKGVMVLVIFTPRSRVVVLPMNWQAADIHGVLQQLPLSRE